MKNIKTLKRNPKPLTAKGKRMMRHIEESNTPGIAAATVYSTAKRGVPGLVKKKWAKEHGYPAKNPAANDFQEGAAKALWANLFSTELEELKRDGWEDLAYELHSGGEIMDDLPPIPEAAYDDARAFEAALVKANGVRSIDDLIQRAAAADGVDVDEEEFGHYTMMPALGEGVSWFDDHGDFVLKLPRWEQSVEAHNAMYDFLEERKADYEDDMTQNPPRMKKRKRGGWSPFSSWEVLEITKWGEDVIATADDYVDAQEMLKNYQEDDPNGSFKLRGVK